MPLFGAAYAAPNKASQFHTNYEPVRDKTYKIDQNMDFRILVFLDRMDNAL